MLTLDGVGAAYGTVPAIDGVTIAIGEGEAVGLLGANGAGKSTCLRAIAGVLAVPAAAVRLAGEAVGGRPAHDLVARGVVMVPEGRRIFPSLSVEENLEVGAYRGRPGPWSLARVYDLFPVLGERRRQPGTNLSGGEQQMLAIGRGLMANPRLLLLDEISLGLAPVVVRGLYRVLRTIAGEGTTTLVVDQDVSQVMELARRVYCFRKGSVSLEGPPAELTRDRLSAAYFGV